MPQTNKNDKSCIKYNKNATFFNILTKTVKNYLCFDLKNVKIKYITIFKG